jgi:hypothetical protein
MSADIFGHKTGIARCYESSKKVQAKLIFRTPAATWPKLFSSGLNLAGAKWVDYANATVVLAVIKIFAVKFRAI